MYTCTYTYIHINKYVYTHIHIYIYITSGWRWRKKNICIYRGREGKKKKIYHDLIRFHSPLCSLFMFSHLVGWEMPQSKQFQHVQCRSWIDLTAHHNFMYGSIMFHLLHPNFWISTDMIDVGRIFGIILRQLLSFRFRFRGVAMVWR